MQEIVIHIAGSGKDQNSKYIFSLNEYHYFTIVKLKKKEKTTNLNIISQGLLTCI
jgi:hypothetical protein